MFKLKGAKCVFHTFEKIEFKGFNMELNSESVYNWLELILVDGKYEVECMI